MIWKPHVTVAAVIERDRRFLIVEEEVEGLVVYNQPAGHLEPDESLIAAVVRETLEETAYHFQPQALTGIYRWRSPLNETTYLRACFSGQCGKQEAGRALDEGILRAVWMDRQEIAAKQTQLRSPLVLRCIDDCLAGKSYPLEILVDVGLGQS
jgi:8-oxo-dGTP pyrophosphatase MutT (NUDIX family)